MKYLVASKARARSLYARPSDDDIKKITGMFANGMSVRAIAAELRIGWQRVRKALITEGIYENDTSRRINELYKGGLSAAEISSKTGIKKAVVHSYLPYRQPQGYTVPLNQLSLTFDSFIEWATNNEKAVGTINSYKVAYSRYAQNFDHIDKASMLEFKRWALDNYQHVTAARMISGMNVFCNFLGYPEWCVRVPRTKKIDSVENIISLEQYQRLMTGLRNDQNWKWYHIVLWLAHTGARPGDIIILTRDCLEKGYQDIINKGMSRRFYIAPFLIDSSGDYFRDIEHDLLFPNIYGHKMSVQGLNAQFKRFGARYKIPDEVMHPYSFRHFFAKQFLEHNKNIALLADILGHWNMDTTRIYLRKSLSEQLEELNQTIIQW